MVKTPVEEINQLYSEMNELAESAVEKAIRIGELLRDERQKCKAGTWLSWLKVNVRFSDQTARNYMRIYKARNKFKTVLNLREALRIVAPKDASSRKPAPKRQDDIVLQAHGKTLRLKKPILAWHIAHSGGAESIICRTCWTHSSGGKNLGTLTNIKSGSWFYACECPDSSRDAVEETA